MHVWGKLSGSRVTCLLQLSLLECCIAALPRSLCRRQLCDLGSRTLLALLRGSLQIGNTVTGLIRLPGIKPFVLSAGCCLPS